MYMCIHIYIYIYTNAFTQTSCGTFFFLKIIKTSQRAIRARGKRACELSKSVLRWQGIVMASSVQRDRYYPPGLFPPVFFPPVFFPRYFRPRSFQPRYFPPRSFPHQIFSSLDLFHPGLFPHRSFPHQVFSTPVISTPLFSPQVFSSLGLFQPGLFHSGFSPLGDFHLA